MRLVGFTSLVLVAACGGTSTRTIVPADTGGGVRAPARAGLKLELQVLAARGRLEARGADGTWTPLAQGAALAGVRELRVLRQGAVVALGHGDAAGRMWLRAGAVVALGQDDAGVHVGMRAGAARVRRPGSALPLFVDAVAGSAGIEGDYLLATRADGATELAPTGAMPALADWSLAIDRPETGAGVGALEAETTAKATEPLALRKVTVDVRTAGDLALTEVEHVFWNGADERREGTFRFPVPDGAMLTGLAMEINGKLMEGEIVERDKARDVYEKIVDSMQDPALLEWEDGNWFKLRVFPLEPKAEKRVIIRYASPLAKTPAGWEYGFSLATPPRDLPIGDLTVKVDGAVVNHEQQVAAGIDLVVPIAADKVPPVMQEVRTDGVYTAVRIALPAGVGARGATGPRRVAVVFDTSRSSLEARPLALGQIARTALGELGPQDQFVVLASDVEVAAHAPDYVAATPDQIGKALAFVEAIEPDGASDVAAALAAAGARAPTDVIYIGDGIPTWGERDRAALGGRAAAIGAPIHAGLVGKGASTELWADVAGRTGGRALVVRREVDARRFALAAVHATDVPRLTAAAFEPIDGATVYPAHATTLYAGDELVALIKSPADRPAPSSLVLTGLAGSAPVRREIALTQPAKLDHVAQRWAAAHLVAMDAAEATREEIVAVSEEYGVLSRYTSLLVLENDEAYKEHQIERRKAAEQAKLAAATPQITGGDLDTLGAREPSLSPDEIQPGDPEIKIPAPADARSVVVSFPFGETKLAVWDADAQAWMVRFLIDKDTPDGDYEVRVTITHADGRIEVMTLPYTVDTQAPAVQLTVARVATGYRIRARQIESANGSRRKDADKIEVVLPDGTIIELAQTAWGRFEAVWETAPLADLVTLRVVVRDRALNQAAHTLTIGQ